MSDLVDSLSGLHAHLKCWLLADGAIAQPKNAGRLKRFGDGARRLGATVVLGGLFGTTSRPYDMNRFFEDLQVRWTIGDNKHMRMTLKRSFASQSQDSVCHRDITVSERCFSTMYLKTTTITEKNNAPETCYKLQSSLRPGMPES
ncbi:hypothetical protein FH972_021799 [Carpinus fangiana]|uniref:Uncharacterized protein n=1 Tax=Carpinus fangiana TaxID=176857 RepID=A0A5N6KQE1_9ROSI|nr:hypothetical protein FH972_021799 [Carpinus fangiana]